MFVSKKKVCLYFFFYTLFYSPFRRERIKRACLPLPRPLIPTVWYISLYSSKHLSIHKLIYNYLCFSANSIIILYCYVHFSLLINISLCQFKKFFSVLYKAANYYNIYNNYSTNIDGWLQILPLTNNA